MPAGVPDWGTGTMPVPPQPSIKTKAIAKKIPARFFPDLFGATRNIPSSANAGNGIHTPYVGVFSDVLTAAWAELTRRSLRATKSYNFFL